MVKEKMYKGQWSSDKAEAKFRAKEQVVWDRAATQPDAIDVATRFGSTRAYRWPGSGTPIVFLHGMTDTSVRWIPYADALKERDVYAIDVMGEVGHSKPDIGFTNASEYSTWLGETLDALGVSKPHLVGESFGGYIALSYAMQPDSVSSLVGLDPVGVVKLKLFRLMRWSLKCGLASFTPDPIRRRLASRLRQPLLMDKPAWDLVMQAQRGHPVKIPPLPVFTDEQLQSITAPIQVLAGVDSTAFDTKKLVERINTTTQFGDAQLLEQAGHGFSYGHFQDCLAAITKATLGPGLGAHERRPGS